jgi:zinc protease
MLNRTLAPKTFAPVEFEYHLPDCNHHTFPNGIPIYYYTDALQPVVQLELVFEAGMWNETQHGVAQATAALLKNGTSQRNSLAINEIIEQYGASVKTTAGQDYASVTVSCLTRFLPHILPLVKELLIDSQFPEEELAIFVQNSKQRLAVQLKKSDFIANRKVDELLFGLDHPYGKYMLPSHYDALHSSILRDFLFNYYRSNVCKLFLAGDFSESDLQLIGELFGSEAWNNTAIPTVPSFGKQTNTQRVHRVALEESGVQGSIRLLSPFVDKHHPDFYPMIVLNTVFGGYFGSRLMSNIREDKGYTYGIHSYLYNHTKESAYLITTEAGKEVCEATIKEIYYEMELLRNEMIDAEELELVKNYLLGTILGDLDGSFQIMQRWKSILLNGFTKDRFNANIEIYKSVTAAQLQLLANTYLQPDRFFELVVG